MRGEEGQSIDSQIQLYSNKKKVFKRKKKKQKNEKHKTKKQQKTRECSRRINKLNMRIFFS